MALVSYGFWQSRLGADPNAPGRAITLSGVPYTVIGVLPREFRGPGELDADLWANNSLDQRDTRGSRYLRVIARLKPGVTIARTEMATISARLAAAYPATNARMEAVLHPLRETLVGDVQPALGGVMGTALAGWLTPGLLALAPEVVRSQAPHLDGRLVVFALVAVMATAGITGLVPAVRTSRADLQTLLKEGLGHAGTRRGARLRGAVIVGELAIALALLSGAGLLLKSFVRLQQVEAGIDPRGVLAMSLNLPAAKYPEERPPQFFNALIAKVSALPGVRAAAVTSILPFGGDWDRIAVDVEGRPVLRGSEKPEADRYIVSPGYHVAMGVPLRQGRLLEDADRYDGALVCLVDEVFARRLQTAGSVLGMRLRLPGRDQFATIVGVVGHVKHYGLDATSSGQIYMSQNQYRWRWMHLVTRTAGDPLALATVARTAVRALDPEQPVFGVTTMAALMAERTAARRFVLTLLGGFAAVALALAGLGLYGVLAYAVSQRTREIGIRLALGADAGRVVRMVVRSGAILAGAGLALGLATAWAFRGLLSRMLFHVGPTDLAVFALVGLVLAAVALLASWLPARRAARVDPMVALKCD